MKHPSTIKIIFSITSILLFCELNAQIPSNKVDSLGHKQGKWIEFRTPIIISDTIYGTYNLAKNQDRKLFPIVECIGEYIDGLRVGTWKEYWSEGLLKSEIEYKSGVPFGNCKTYWGNGTLKTDYVINESDSTFISAYNEDGTLYIQKNVSKKHVIRTIYNE